MFIQCRIEAGKTAWKYKQSDCIGTYEALSEIGKRKRKFVCRGAKIKLRSIVLHTCTCKVISHLYRNKLDVDKRGEGGPGSGGRSGKRGPFPRSGGGAPFGGFLCRSSRYNKVQFYCRSAGRERALSLPFSDNVFIIAI